MTPHDDKAVITRAQETPIDPPQSYYQHGGITIYHGDFERLFPAIGVFDHLITDPPYEAESHTSQRLVNRGDKLVRSPLSFAAITEEQRNLVGLFAGQYILRWSLIFCQAEAVSAWRSVLVKGGVSYRRACVWIKPDSKPNFSGDGPGIGYENFIAAHAPGRSRWGGGGSHGVYTHSLDRNNLGHKTQKPIKLIRDLVRLFTDPGETIIDPFCGSGTTLRAAKDLGRKAVGIDINEKYCEIAARRMAQDVLF